MPLMTLLKDQDVKRGFQSDPEREGSVEFGVTTVSGTEFVVIRIGRTVAERAGLRAKDRLALFIDKAVDGENGPLYHAHLGPHPKGWVVQSADLKSEHPALVLRVTFRDEWPYYLGTGTCQKVVARDKRIDFILPDGTTLGKPKNLLEIVPDGVDADTYEEHKEIVEKDLPRRKKKAEKTQPQRRKSDKALTMKDGKPYGRRAGD